MATTPSSPERMSSLTLLPIVSGFAYILRFKIAPLLIQKAAVITTNKTQTYIYNETAWNVTATRNHNKSSLAYPHRRDDTDVGFYRVIVSAADTATVWLFWKKSHSLLKTPI
jgi:hypothetical protein